MSVLRDENIRNLSTVLQHEFKHRLEAMHLKQQELE